jgi:hypothetical protein
MVFVLSRDSRHYALEPPSVAFLIILMNQKGMNHFMNQGALNLCKVIVFIPKQLFGQVNLRRLKSLAARVATGKSFAKAASFVSAITSGGGHPSIPDNRNLRNLIVKMLGVQAMKHRFNIRLVHCVSL